jgi:ribonuclease-3
VSSDVANAANVAAAAEASRADALDRLEAALGYRFDRRALLENALSHSSYAHEKSTPDAGAVVHNERLEFLGDAVLGLAVANALYRAKPDWREGDLSRALHSLVDGRSLSKLARSLELGSVIRLGRTEQQSGGKDKPSILENAMEAVIGAVYLDGGLDATSALVDRVFGEALAADAAPVRRDPKTELQERVMAAEAEFPGYRVVNDSLIEGDERRFTVEVVVRGNALARGVGRTKRSAERLAAAAALEKWEAQASVES